MLKNHPKGLLPAAIANMGERFGFYVMMAILTLFLMAKFGLTEKESGDIYSIFYGAIYILALVGGIIADRIKNYKGTIIAGLFVMTIGYALLAVPSLITGKYIALGCLLIIAFGNGLFKGNLQALVGQMYDDPRYSAQRDTGFQIFYMFINVGGIFAPFAATYVRDAFVKSQGFLYNADLPSLCWSYLNKQMSPEVFDGTYTKLATEVSNGVTPDMTTFADSYLNAFNTGFHYAFSVAIVAMLISLIVFVLYKKRLPDPATKEDLANNHITISKEEIKQDAQEIKQRLLALFAVFAVVIFFWFSFHQNGLTLTFFAKDYTLLKIGNWSFAAENFQAANPFIVVLFTPIIMAIFSFLSKKGLEPSTPRKIGIGMGIAALAFFVMAVGSMDLPDKAELIKMGTLPMEMKVTPWLLFATYFILTIAELFISPLGLSFVSKVAPKHLQGLMQGCWLGATAIGNFSLSLGAVMYLNTSQTITWSVFAIVCGISLIAMFSMVKWLERVAK